MLFSIIIPSYNCEAYLEDTLQSILEQKGGSVKLEIIVIDGNSTDATHSILKKYSSGIKQLVIESDNGPAEAINKGFAMASGDIVSWLNADDVYLSGTLARVADHFENNPETVFCFGKCPIVDEHLQEIRQGITKFKEFFYPLNSRFTYQCINYISQPATFFARSAVEQVGPLREDMVAAWDYEYFLRLWRVGKGMEIKGKPVSYFRWHEESISGQNFLIQFKEELDATIADAGKFSPQTMIHHCVRAGIVTIYSAMSWVRARGRK